MTKQCSKCKEVKPVSEFHKHRSMKDGLQHSCKDCTRVRGASWYKANADRKRANNTAWKKANPERERARNAAYKKANPERSRAYTAAYARANPEKVRANNARRRARKAGASVAYLPSNYKKTLFDFYGNRCMMPGCDKEINAQNPLTEDHIIPISKGGPHAFYNLQVLCLSCNCSKQDRNTDDYRNGRMLVGAHDPKFSLWDYMKEHKSVTIKR